ncbi:MAG TPA: outer membrane beta-barrel protein [Candidatus Deferrimicrobiaceae bacterium]
MKKGILSAVVCSVLLLAAAPVFAAGGYLGIEGGAVWPEDVSFSGSGANADLSFDTGWSLGAVAGYNFGTWRLEGEYAYRSNSNDGKVFFGTSGVSESGGGDTVTNALMLNAFYDFRMVSPTVYPYLGAGGGVAWVDQEVSTPTFRVNDSDTVFAYQFIAGIGFDVSKAFTMTLDYRYFATADPSYTFNTTSGASGSFNAESKSSNVMLTLRFNF